MAKPSNQAENDFRDHLTVVVAPVSGGEALVRCRAALEAQAATVITAAGGGELSIPALRTQALRAAQTRYVALVEDTALVAPDWCSQGLASLDAGAAAVGGTVSISPDLDPRSQALGLCEYAGFQDRRVRTGPDGAAAADHAGALPGLGFMVDRAAALAVVETAMGGLFFEGEVFERLRAAGKVVRYIPTMTLSYSAPHPQGAALKTRRLHGRLYAGRRLPRGAPGRRLIYALASPLLAILLTYRALGSRPAALRLSPQLLFWVLAMSCAWAWGEFVGYLTGDVGDGLSGWR